nr:hypothetical protein [Candidatus Gracilibacteria bacterium]
MFKKIFLFIITYFIVFPTIQALAQEEKQYFIVTAYYSPLPDQDYYLKGSYEADIKLNGGGIRGASGQNVFEGMLAGPKKYDFGTKIYLEGLGTGIIADRGGAIVSAGERGYDSDRIDVWMGYGDDGLKKALSWGKRKVIGKIITESGSSETPVGLSFNGGNVNLSKYKQNKELIYTKNLGITSKLDDVKLLQEKLKILGIYKGKVDGIYNKDLINTLVTFQIENGIIKNENEYGAGYWGIKTRDKVFQKEKELANNNKIKLETPETKDKELVILPKNIFDVYIHPESSIEDIKQLQKKLTEMELYSGAITGKYNDIKNVLINYQLKQGIINDKTDIGAGYFGPKTREELKNDYALFVAKKDEEDRNRRKLEELKSLALKQANDQIEKIGTPKLGDVSQNVRELQKTLATLGHFDGKDTAIYGEVTKQSIYEYQVSKNLVSKLSDPGAGKIGDITKAEIKKDLTKLLLDRKLKETSSMAYDDKKAGN